MNSPGRMSPTNSESSSDSPDNELDEYTRAGAEDPTPFVSHSTSSGFAAASKRRLPGGMYIAGFNARDPKSRRKDLRGGGGMWDQGGPGSSRSQRGDDLVDQALVDMLRVQFGDPFDETPLKKASVGN
ncbi:hypothetical protein L227DRAFT_609419 [Lentinus tigrinus ALCF2SS1-6]|uniref:Uncharacterized protein n=1 Tax=Lentinus tigrinus ALCF2SS1-6 TaxID=1328759 RepID=A0A5C2SGE9_9APHY|nr:hypothetical protein L227DRAFT_609419 [Lentinus tigrinus ALCF2SS1-6]